MAESTYHQEWIIMIKENLEALTVDKEVFVASDLLWYPVEGQVRTCKAPDVMVCIGRPKGHRLSYLQWHEEGMAPQVVFEIYSKSNRRRRNKENLIEFYDKYGVEEFYSYDPLKNNFVIHLRQSDGGFARLEGLTKWVSPLLKIRFERGEEKLRFYRPNGQEFIKYDELERQNKYLKMMYEEVKAIRDKEYRRILEVEDKLEKQMAETERQLAEAERQKAETEKQKAEVQKQKAEVERQKSETEKQKAAKEKAQKEAMRAIKEKEALLGKLREMGIDPDAV